ncbi:MAG: glycosyltransferase family 4 protein [Gemmatimonadota bacterium]
MEPYDHLRNEPPRPTADTPTRIMVLAPQPFFEDRGTPIALKQVLRGLAELGIGADVVTYPLGRDPEVAGVNVIRCANPLGIRSVPVGFSLRKIVLDITLWIEAQRALRRGRYAAIQASEEAAFLAVLLGRRHGLPVVYDMQSSLPEHLAERRLFRLRPIARVLERIERWLVRRVDLIVTSAGLGEHARALGPRAPVFEWRFHAPADPVAPTEVVALRRELDLPPGAPVILYTGTFVPYQGIDTLDEAIPRVLRAIPDAFFVLVGASGRWRPTGDPDPASRVRVAGRRPRSEMRRFYALADVAVSPRASGRNLPLKIFDYLGAGRAIVATDVPAHRSILDDDLAVLVAPEPHAFADGIVRLLQDEGLRRRYADAAAAYGVEELGWRPFVHRLRTVYEALPDLSGPGAGP